MIKKIPLYLYGAIIIVEGILFFISKDNTLQSLKLPLGIGLIIGSILAFITAFTRKKRQVQFAYHEIHALTMLVYGLAITFFCSTIEMLTSFTAFLLIFYAFSEIIFCSWLFNLGEKVLYKVLLIRVALGFITGIGAVVALHFANSNIDMAIMVFGVLFVLIGINIILYIPILKEDQESELLAKNNA